MSRRRTLLLALALLAAGLWLIFAESGTGSRGLDGGADRMESEAPPRLLTSAAGEGGTASPGLAGWGAGAEAASRRGPVRVRVVGMDGDTQRLDMLVDHVGRRTLRHVEPGRVRLRAEWSSRRASREIDVVEGGETTIRLELPPPARRR